MVVNYGYVFSKWCTVEKADLNQNKHSSITIPFLKWAGGKRWLVSKHSQLFPENYNRYLEPFLGSGAVFFHLQPDVSILGDMNSDLIDTYKALKEDWSETFTILEKYHSKHSKSFYYEIRDKTFVSLPERAARFIYLNRTCWNGLYRVNLKGTFNVPIGTKQNVVLNTDDFESISNLLRNAQLYSTDFQTIIDAAGKDDFIFIDPPYTVKHNLNGFIKYNEHIFSWEDQIRLRDCIDNAMARGAKILLTNADHPSIRDLYKDLGTIKSLDRLSVISGNAKARGRFSELVMKSY
ncbi:DNA adenine methylase [Kiloniella sp. b19]|uniref:DNA adenine methylase n=1 Tax=Kiloniella sp. GXU_MW_B19 TaxID=3141326 RepID=UPI0031D0FB62